MLGEPSAKHLVEAVAGFLEGVALPKLEGHAAFHAKVALNVLATIARELEEGPDAARREHGAYQRLGIEGGLLHQRMALCEKIRSGDVTAQTAGVLPALLAIAADRVRIEQPGYASLKLADPP